ncbi:MAG: HipA domain-containing protein [Proteobacteria bacterium]|nr:HipA domain-containing protein [Pseudomonadota bacterium]
MQTTIFDVADWESDPEFGVFPQGARAKDAVFAPLLPPEPVLVPGKRYLFKRSKRSYPDQFWGEIIAYRISCLLGVKVPPTFAAWNSKTGHCAALSEWFYDENTESFVMAGDFLQMMHKDFDRKLGTLHNFEDNMVLLRMFSIRRILIEPHWCQWWVDALLFDALIGNTDRHQDNWGFIFTRSEHNISCRLAPLFDNGTSLGHERFTDRVKLWSKNHFDRYIENGKHHLKWSLDDPVQGHFELLKRAVDEWPDTRDAVCTKLNFSVGELSDVTGDLLRLDAAIPLSQERYAFILHLLKERLALLKAMFL